MSHEPHRTAALVVGIGRYRVGSQADLSGPVADACRFVNWLLRRGVPEENIALFLSPVEGSRPPGADGFRAREATYEALRRYLTDDLPRLPFSLLLVHWGGHGVMTAEEGRRLFLADATSSDRRNLDFDHLLTFLRSSYLPYGAFPRQVFLVDACASFAEEQRWTKDLPTDRLPVGQRMKGREQLVLFATRAGEWATDLPDEGTGLFSRELQILLGKTPDDEWPPDFARISEAIKRRFEALRRAEKVDQTPIRLWIRGWDGEQEVIGEAGRGSGGSVPRRLLPPRLPPHYLERSELLAGVKAALLTDKNTGAATTARRRPAVLRCMGSSHIGLQGMSGIGKTVLAAAATQDPEVVAAFPDGVFWLTVGRDPDLTGLLVDLAAALGSPKPAFSSIDQGKREVRELLASQEALVVLDDVWTFHHAELLDVAAGSCRLLITSRNREVLVGLGAYEHRIEVLEPRQAMALLADWAGMLANDLPPVAAEVIRECGHLPLALAMVGAMVRLRPSAWDDALARLRRADLEALKRLFPDYPYPDLLRALEASVQALEPAERERYLELAVLPEGTAVPMATLEVLWSSAGLSNEDARTLATVFMSRSLASENSFGHLELHDLQRTYIVKRATSRASLHRRLVDAYRRRCGDGWHTGPADGYFFQRLAYHLAQAGRTEILSGLLFDFEWLQAKLRAAGTPSLISDFDLAPPNAESSLLQAALRLSGHALAADPDALPGQLLGRLSAADGFRISNLLRDAASSVSRPWLRPVRPCLTSPGSSSLETLSARRGSRCPPAVLDARRVALGTIDGVIRVWDLAEQKVIQELHGHTDGVEAVATWASDVASGLLASGSADSTLRLWDLQTGTTSVVLSGHRGAVLALLPLGDGLLVSGSADCTLRLWDPTTGTCQKELVGHGAAVTSLCAVGGSQVISGSADGALRIWDIETGECVGCLTGHEGQINDVAVLSGNRLASCADDGTIRLWDLSRQEATAVLKGHASAVSSVLPLGEGRLASSGHDFTVRTWDLTSGREGGRIKSLKFGVMAMQRLDERRFLLIGLDVLEIWDLRSRRKLQSIQTRSGWIWELLVVNRDLVAAATSAPAVKLLDATTLEPVGHLEGHTDEVYSLARLDDDRILSASRDGTIRLWNVPHRATVRVFSGHGDAITGLAVLSPDRFVSTSEDGTWRLWKTNAGTPGKVVQAHRGSVLSVEILGGGRILTSSDDRTIKIWDLEQGRRITTIKKAGVVPCVAVLGEDRIVTAHLEEQVLRLWDLTRGKILALFKGHTDWTYTVLPLAPGLVVSCSDDCTVRVWSVERAITIASFRFDCELSTLVLHPDGRLLVGDIAGEVHALVFEPS